ncbi:hypothetical protein QL285_053786 [Trifolium repens]|nr:hypothetical protein QL285_053786 [Trifolium repens]
MSAVFLMVSLFVQASGSTSLGVLGLLIKLNREAVCVIGSWNKVLSWSSSSSSVKVRSSRFNSFSFSSSDSYLLSTNLRFPLETLTTCSGSLSF